MKPYPKYKPTGIDWIGDIPRHWNLFRIKNVLASQQNGIWGEDRKGDTNDTYCIRVADFDRGFDNLSKEDNTMRNILEKDFTHRKLEINDLLIEKSGGGEISPVGRVGVYNWTNRKSVTSNFMSRLRPKIYLANYKFLFYYFKKMYANRINVKSINQTTGIQNLDTYSYLNELISLPPKEEQTAIANYLDEKTAQIDKLIASKQKLIELLKEERTAIINNAVTKGINPKAKLKPSGVQWLGDVPEGWEVKKLKYVAKMQGGFAFKSEDFVSEGMQLIRIGNLYQNEFALDRQPIFLPEEYMVDYNNWVVKDNDILISMTGTLGKRDYGFAIQLPQTGQSFFLNQRVSKISFNENVILRELGLQILHSSYYLDQLFLLPTGTKQGNISNEQILSVFAIFPTAIEEQKELIKFISETNEKINTTISKIEKEIELMQEYRTALISEVVTGKIKII